MTSRYRILLIKKDFNCHLFGFQEGIEQDLLQRQSHRGQRLQTSEGRCRRKSQEASLQG